MDVIFVDNAPEKIKRTCDGCSASKVKCSGDQPCTRCSSRGIDCFYRARKKRAAKLPETVEDGKKKTKAPPPHPDLMITVDHSPSVLYELSSSPSVLRPHEKRSWIVFFSLYKNYATGCARFWFERQLARIKMRLESAGQTQMLEMLKEWAARVDVDYEAAQDRGGRCIKALTDGHNEIAMRAHTLAKCGGLHLHVNGKVAPCNNVRLYTKGDASRVPLESVFSLSESTARVSLHFSGTFPEDVAILTVNPAFEQLFGISQKEVSDQMKLTGSGLLPWGGDLIAMLAHSESDVFAFMQVCAINLSWNFLTRDMAEFPLIREAPSAHVIPFNVPHSEQPVPCLLKCVHRELIDLVTGISLEIVMSFEPLQPLVFLPNASLNKSGTPNSAFERELPLADESDKSVSNAEDISDDDANFDSGEAYYPDVQIDTSDNFFFEELLTFARIQDETMPSLEQMELSHGHSHDGHSHGGHSHFNG